MKSKSKFRLSIAFFLMAIPGLAIGALDFTPGVTVSEEYTDNIDLTHEDEEHEYITLYGPFAQLDFRGRKTEWSLAYRPTYADYNRFSENDGWRHSAELTSTTDLSRRTQLLINDAFLLTDDPVSDEDTTIRRERQTYYTNTSSIGLEHQLGPRNTITSEYSYSFLENEDDTVVDSQHHNGHLWLEYWLSPNNFGVETYGDYTRGLIDGDDDFTTWAGTLQLNKQLDRHFSTFVRYTHTVQDFDGDTEDYQVYDPAIGIDYVSDEESTFSIGVGYYYRNLKESDDESGFFVSADISKTWERPRSSFTLTGASGYTETQFESERLGFTLFYSAGGEYTYQLARDFGLNAFAGHTRNDYQDTDDDRIDNLSRIGGGLTWQLLEWMRTDITYSYRILNSTIDDNDYNENRVLLSITLVPARPILLIH